MAARSVEEKVRAIVGMETRGVSPDALGEVASALKLLVRSAETALRTVNKAGESEGDPQNVLNFGPLLIRFSSDIMLHMLHIGALNALVPRGSDLTAKN